MKSMAVKSNMINIYKILSSIVLLLLISILTGCDEDQAEIITLRIDYDELPKKGSQIEGYKNDIAFRLGENEYLEIEVGQWSDDSFQFNSINKLPISARFTYYSPVDGVVPEASGSLKQTCLTCVAAPSGSIPAYEITREEAYSHVSVSTKDNSLLVEIENLDKRLNLIEKIDQLVLSVFKKKDGELCVDRLFQSVLIDLDGDGTPDPINNSVVYDNSDEYESDYYSSDYELGVLQHNTSGCNILSATLEIN